jgi:signal transduction histidine kinase/CheY-like chemotaxis protein
LLLVWTGLVIFSVAYNLYHIHTETLKKAQVEARAVIDLTLAFRKWNTIHGGVYVPVTENFKPNPYLKVPDRDKTTTDGTKLTLINPAWMTRQIYEILGEQSQLPAMNRLVSLKYLNPVNKPDKWEEKALLAFEASQSRKGMSQLTSVNGNPYLRLMIPLITEEGCLKCHPGYRIGDVRGGISIAVPMKPYYEGEAMARKNITITHLFLWLAGVVSIVVFSKNIWSQQKKLESTVNQLVQSQKMESLGLMAGGVAHDFNNLLTGIMGYSSLLREKLHDSDNETKDYLQQILDASVKAQGFTSSLLAFSRKQIIEPRVTSLNEVIKNISGLLKRLVGEEIELKFKYSEAEFPVFIDPHQLEQVVMNLAINAKDAMPSGGTLSMETTPLTLGNEYTEKYGLRPGKYMMLSVSDTGTGIDKKDLSHIFEPFFTTKEKGKGTGLGLSMVYGIIKQHEGVINVYSEKDIGTTFKIYLPAAEEKKKMERETGTAETVVDFRGEGTILIAEDEDTVRNFLKDTLEIYGYKTIIAVDGGDAIAKYEENRGRIDMLILDVVMPKKNGKEVYDYIRTIEPDIKAIFISGYTEDILTSKGVCEEGLEFLSKPLEIQTLMQKIKEILS